MGVEPTRDGSTAPQTVLKTAPVTGPGAAPPRRLSWHTRGKTCTAKRSRAAALGGDDAARRLPLPRKETHVPDDEKTRDAEWEAEWAGIGVAPTGPFGANRAMPSAKFIKKPGGEGDGDLKFRKDESWRSHKEEED